MTSKRDWTEVDDLRVRAERAERDLEMATKDYAELARKYDALRRSPDVLTKP